MNNPDDSKPNPECCATESNDARLLAAIVESSDDAIISENLDGVITSWNHGAELIFGYTAREVLGRPISLLYPPERHAEETLFRETTRKSQSLAHYETVRIRKDGQPVDISVTVSPIKDGAGNIIGGSKIARDISGRKKAEEQIRLMGAALEAAANGIVITDQKGRILWANKAFEQLTGYSVSEVIGLTPRLLKSGREQPSFYQDMWDTITAGKVWSGDLINKRKDGSLYHESMMIAPLAGSIGAPTHYIAIKQDVSERVNAAQEREQLIGQLKQALSEVKTLTGLLPICATCKKIRDDSGYWSQVEVFIKEHSNATFTHGICPACAKKMLEELKEHEL